MTQEKLRDRAEKWAAKNCDVNTSALTVFAREQLQKAQKIAEDHIWPSPADKQDSAQNFVSRSIAEKIGKLMD